MEKKSAMERKNELLDVAEILFYTKGYSKTTISDIITTVGIAKGTFYYYFKSKEEIMDALIYRIVENDIKKSKQIAKDNKLSPVEKIFAIMNNQQSKNIESKIKIMEQLSKPENSLLQQKSIVLSIQNLSPILTLVVKEGIKKKIFKTVFPQEAIEILLVSGHMLFEPGLFQWSPKEIKTRINAFIDSIEKLLGANSGTFSKLNDILIDKIDNENY